MEWIKLGHLILSWTFPDTVTPDINSTYEEVFNVVYIQLCVIDDENLQMIRNIF